MVQTETVGAGANDNALRARALDNHPGRRIAIDEQLNLGCPPGRHDDATNDTGGCKHGHIGAQSIPGSLVDRHRAELWTRSACDHGRCRRLQLNRGLELEQTLKRARLLRKRTLLLQTDLQRREFLL